jgi:NADH-quinone oxidoreductase subunit N
MLTTQQWIALLPLLIISTTVLALMAAIAVKRHYNACSVILGTGLVLALGSLVLGSPETPLAVGALLIVDPFARLMMALILLTSIACLTLGHTYFQGYGGNREELFLLFAMSVLGTLTLACSRHLASAFVGIELMAVPSYGMVAYDVEDRSSLEAGLKYFILSAASSAFMLFGMALLYALSGTLTFRGMAPLFIHGDPQMLAVIALALVSVGVGFKLSFAPFHLWTPDVYQGAPAPVTAFLATVVKAGMVAVFVRLVVETSAISLPVFKLMLGVLAVSSILIGNLLAVGQRNIKRLLGYSSVAHVGYLLVAAVAGTQEGMQAVVMYLIAYLITATGSFGVVSILSSTGAAVRDAHAIQDYRGMFWRYPFLGTVMTMAMLSLASVPLTVGFVGKFQTAMAVVDVGQWGLVAAQMIGSAIGVYYCLRVVIALFLPRPGMSFFLPPERWRQQGSGLMLMGLSGVMLVVGVWPQPLITLIRAARLMVLPG